MRIGFDARFVDDRYHYDVPETAARLGLRDRLLERGHVPDEDLAALYCGAMCMAIVSLYEGFGMPALEALACGAPLIVSDRGSLPEIASGEAIVLNPWDVQSIAHGLERIVGNEALRASLRQRGSRVASQFTWTAAAQATRRAPEQAYRPDAGRRARYPSPSVPR